MANEFINPNWHVVLIHYPLALVTVGVLAELFSFLWPYSTVRVAGRWMILLGALLCVPTVTLGLYALRDVVTPGPINDDLTWKEVVRSSPWQVDQWNYMKKHIICMIAATGLFLLSVVVWLGASDEGRRKLRAPVLVVLVAGLGFASVGAWYSGEAVYRYGTAVQRVESHGGPAIPSSVPTTLPAGAVTAQASGAGGGGQEEEGTRPLTGKVEWYIPPMQLHLLLAGLTVAVAVGAIGLSIRRWTHQLVLPARTERVETAPGVPGRGEVAGRPVVVGVPPAGQELTAASRVPFIVGVFPARFWLLAFLLAVATAAAGLWLAGDWRLVALLDPIRKGTWRTELGRLPLHVVGGTSIVTLSLLLALITRVSRRARGITIFFVLLLLIAVAMQVWLGILLVFDSDQGPVTKFN